MVYFYLSCFTYYNCKNIDMQKNEYKEIYVTRQKNVSICSKIKMFINTFVIHYNVITIFYFFSL